MSKILGRERIGHRTKTDVLNSDGSITFHTSEDVEPVFKKAQILSERPYEHFKFKASIPLNVMDEVCKIKAAEWGIEKGDVFMEIMGNESQRAQAVLRTLTEGRDFRKFQRVN